KYQNPDLLFKQVQTLFEEFMSDRDIVIDPLVITDVYILTNGQQKLELKILSQEIRGYQTFHKLINKLKESYSMKAIKFLHQYLLDAIVFTKVPDQHDHLIEFLAAEGVLTPADSFLNKVRLSFPFVGIYIKMDVLSELFSHISRSEIPLDKDQKLDILKMLQVIVTFFDVKLIHLAPLCCFKKATVPVNVGQDGDYVHHYVDIVINGNEENIVLELVVTANQSNLEEHFNHALFYGDNLVATAI
ncbi:18634_t:CDS:2, partial [Funneliformis geosporum]